MPLSSLLVAGIVWAAVFAAFKLPAAEDRGDAQTLEPRFVHLRSGEAREWSSFPEKPDGKGLSLRFAAKRNDREFTLRLRQQDVKQSWQVVLNDKRIGDLVTDENDMVTSLAVPPGALVEGENVLQVVSRGGASDDIRVGEVRLEERPRAEVLSECTVEMEVADADSKQPVPCRITIADANGSLHPTSATSNDHLACRTGVVYTSTGHARFGLPAGKFTLYASRGFEYSLAQAEVSLAPGESIKRQFSIRREVPASGYIACDTHIHTLSFSGHGDCSLEERMVTLAGEGIELPIATDHNVHVDYRPHAEKMHVRQYFTPVIGNEVTTAVGHFNIFPVDPGAAIPDFKQKEWPAIFREIHRTPGVKVAILNHARDLHSGTRPFGPKHFNSVSGENVSGWPMRFNAMEVINSGATQTDPLRLVRDWMALLNRGYPVTPVGSSDSHDVSRYIVGQGRTYIRVDDRDLSRLDVGAAESNFLNGKVLVSYGLIAEMTAGGKYGPGDFVPVVDDELPIEARVLGPHWSRADKIQLYANGKLIREETLAASADDRLPAGIKWQGCWKLPRPKHDVHLVAVALGPGIASPHWPTARPYQPTSPDFQPYTLGISGAIWLDGDGDGRKSSAHDYAVRLMAESRGVTAKLVASLADFDEATAAQAASLYQTSGTSLTSDQFQSALKNAAPHVQDGFRAYQAAWRENELARPDP